MITGLWGAIGPTVKPVVPILESSRCPILEHGFPLTLLDVTGIDFSSKVFPIGHCGGGFLDEGVHVLSHFDALVAGANAHWIDDFATFLCFIRANQDKSHRPEDAEDDEKGNKSLCRHGDQWLVGSVSLINYSSIRLLRYTRESQHGVKSSSHRTCHPYPYPLYSRHRKLQ